jgi:hypothetical protein
MEATEAQRPSARRRTGPGKSAKILASHCYVLPPAQALGGRAPPTPPPNNACVATQVRPSVRLSTFPAARKPITRCTHRHTQASGACACVTMHNAPWLSNRSATAALAPHGQPLYSSSSCPITATLRGPDTNTHTHMRHIQRRIKFAQSRGLARCEMPPSPPRPPCAACSRPAQLLSARPLLPLTPITLATMNRRCHGSRCQPLGCRRCNLVLPHPLAQNAFSRAQPASRACAAPRLLTPAPGSSAPSPCAR